MSERALSRFPLPYAFARAHQVLLERHQGRHILWVSALPDAHSQRQLRSTMAEVRVQFPVEQVEYVEPTEWAQRVQSAYADHDSSAALVVNDLQGDSDLQHMMQSLPAVEDLLETADDAPIIRMLNALLMQAVRDGASDIHVEPYERHSVVRFRIDGNLREVVQPNRALHGALISRLKIMAELDIAEKRLPQDGRISLRLGQRAVDVRVSTLPNAHGERAVLRLLDKSGTQFSLDALGMQGAVRDKFERLVSKPHGILLVTGPTGSGKTTTLYAALKCLNAARTNIMTVEDPIEYELGDVAQTQVQPKIDLTFANALRAILRQDPDVVMIGEIRDTETAQIAVQASLTGHLVLATLHTNDAASAITRLTDMGIEPFLLSSSLVGVLGQRLVRKLCTACQGAGCDACSQQGFAGRTGIFELLEASDSIKALIHQEAPESELRAAAIEQGMVLLRDDGQRLVREGITRADELMRVTQ